MTWLTEVAKDIWACIKGAAEEAFDEDPAICICILLTVILASVLIILL